MMLHALNAHTHPPPAKNASQDTNSRITPASDAMIKGALNAKAQSIFAINALQAIACRDRHATSVMLAVHHAQIHFTSVINASQVILCSEDHAIKIL